jgi:LPXTG-site transpeptidase (sortase) family protein
MRLSMILVFAALALGMYGGSAPVSAATPNAAMAASKNDGQPVRIVIDDIDMDRKLVSVGLDRNKIPVVPKHDIGWYNLSARPGQGENIVLWGHVLRFKSAPKLPAPFARLKELKKGAEIVLYTKDGASRTYVVSEQVKVKPDQVQYILPQGEERLTLVSCTGDKVIKGGNVEEMTHRLITIAVPK